MTDPSPWPQLAAKLKQDKPGFVRVFHADELDAPPAPGAVPTRLLRALDELPFTWQEFAWESSPLPFLAAGGTAEGIASADLVILHLGAVCIPILASLVNPILGQIRDLALLAQGARPWQPAPGCTLLVAPVSGDPTLPRWQHTVPLLDGLADLAAELDIPFANPHRELFWRLIAGDTRERYFVSPERPELTHAGEALWSEVTGQTLFAALLGDDTFS